MHLLKGFVIAFSMYSTIPMPKTEWKEEDMRYVMCFFPLVGIVIGGLCWLWVYLCGLLGIGTFARAGILAVIPVFVAGGIHVDGFMDTMDALHSHREKERKLEILKDSHVGAFAVIMLVVLGVLMISVLTELTNEKMMLIFCIGFFLSRTMSGLALVTIPNARGSGTADTFAGEASRRKVRTVLLLYAAVALILMAVICPWAGVAMTLMTACWYFGMRNMAVSNFGGITGDILGYYLLISELLTAVVAAVFSIGMRLV